MKILDLFCGIGGAAMGYHMAFPEATIVGVDLEPQPDYPFSFIQADAFAMNLDGYDLVHASPPCQFYSVGTKNTSVHPDLAGAIATRLSQSGVSYVIENVMQAPIRKDLKLCGSMFGLQIQRHRIFEHNLNPMNSPPLCNHLYPEGRPYTVSGHGGGVKAEHSWNYRDTAHAQALMEIRWSDDRKGIIEAVPPAYTQWIGMNWRST